MLSKRRVVMSLHHDQAHPDTYKYFEAASDDDGSRTDGYYMRNENFEDFGSPEEITVTVEPGNTIEQDDDGDFRDAGTGRYVGSDYAKDNPDTTVHES